MVGLNRPANLALTVGGDKDRLVVSNDIFVGLCGLPFFKAFC